MAEEDLDNPIFTMGFEPEIYPKEENSNITYQYNDLLGWIRKSLL